ncbi:MAG: 2OG-Fe(II) oxygenase [Myxococcota bacterium]
MALVYRWLAPQHLDTRRLAEDAAANPAGKVVIIDNAFAAERLPEIERTLARARYTPDNDGLNYDSASMSLDPTLPLSELFRDASWLRWIHAAVGMRFAAPKTNRVALRRHRPAGRGFWPHVDDLRGDPKRLALLAYFNHGWSAADGGALQLWEATPPRRGARPLCWHAYVGRRLDFLGRRREVVVELGGPGERPVNKLRLVDTITPSNNRIVILALRPGQLVHSVTPSNGRSRRAILQWIS